MKKQCLNCPDRYVGCHSECDDYKAFRAERDKRLEQQDLNNRSEPFIPKERLKKLYRGWKKYHG